ncbi:MAG TPA: flagellar hook protein FlgE [Edaphobacter sp.]|uniref:flagellar hook protein FlgE n=1 Tax=Edaphobacter sp. TaxID=1934404 RepID=UPI002C493D09|nr:flagellar hook protein FlgE [Edaphobacter sp.]HUZ94107.1 flagellar hook protein FlgE [Edaphobacter sp.]
MSAFSIPLSGLAAESAALNAIANNLANLNTDGYKSQSISFGDLFNQMQGVSGNGDPIQVGSGVEVGGITSDYSNGSVNSTGIATNMALQGNGFFVVRNSGDNQMSFTRDGNFSMNAQGQLCTSGGQLVLGYPAANGQISSGAAPVPINLNDQSTIPSVATSSFQMTTNLDANAATGATFSSPISVYDSLGNAHALTVQYTKTGSNTWSYSVTIPSADVGGTGTTTQVASGTLTFDSSGNLTSPASPVSGIKISGLADGAADMSLSWDLTGSGGASLLTQQASTSATASTTQNGYGVGTLTGFSVLPDGTIQGQFSNNQTLALGQVAVASFSNVQGLTQTGNGNLVSTAASGAAVIGKAGAGGNGSIVGDAVENSNVNLSAEFSSMIVAQQGYEASAKVLTTMNQISQATIQLIT